MLKLLVLLILGIASLQQCYLVSYIQALPANFSKNNAVMRKKPQNVFQPESSNLEIRGKSQSEFGTMLFAQATPSKSNFRTPEISATARWLIQEPNDFNFAEYAPKNE